LISGEVGFSNPSMDFTLTGPEKRLVSRVYPFMSADTSLGWTFMITINNQSSSRLRYRIKARGTRFNHGSITCAKGGLFTP